MASSREYGQAADENRYRSWGEIQIARLLNHHRIGFHYEQPVAVVDRGKVRLWYPDFQLSDMGIIIEYCGRPQDPNYAQGMVRKEAAYAANGLTALMITPDIFRGPWPSVLLNEIEGVLDDRLSAFRTARYAGTGTFSKQSDEIRTPASKE
jgi:hypothetical protein